MKQYDAVIKVMEQNGGFATLGFLYQNALNVPGVEWKTKTPFKSINRIVQDARHFFKIKPGLWALNTHRDRLPLDVFPRGISLAERKASDHSYYQGLILEIGNFKHFATAVPNQDKNKMYLNKKLGEVATVKEFYQFSYDHVVKRASTIDVVWFNERKMPASCFEVEHSTDISNSLLKFVELQDFHTKFFIVADVRRQAGFEAKRKFAAFSTISGQIRFMSYGHLADLHAKTYELSVLEEKLEL